ncbi:RDD family protein [Brachybacterium hainanense]|uniref:RDD family protein n=1 Tax=Brachybacterium hainanense TaxID=1541174 RepID=A0ABV6RGL8_9MICO
MDEQGNTPVHGPASAPAIASAQPAAGIGVLEAPLDGCAPSTPGKRLVAAIVDGIISSILMVPWTIGISILAVQGQATTLSLVLIGVGAALPVAYAIVLLWLHGSKGFTPGKLMMGLRTVRLSTGGPIGFLRALGRAVVFGIISLVMALSIFLDPRKLLRGFHDRAVDSVVVDVKAGRDPFQERADDFRRPGTEHYQPSGPVAVSAHENLMSTPGAAWTSAASADPAGAAPIAGVPSASSAPAAPAWGAAAPAADPWAPAPASEPSAPPQAEPSAPPVSSAPQAEPFSAPPAFSPPTQNAWAAPAPVAPAEPLQPSWEPSASQQPVPEQPATDAWNAAPEQPAPAPAAPAWAPAPEQPAPAPASQPWPAPEADTAAAAEPAVSPVAEETSPCGAPPDASPAPAASSEIEADLEATRLSAIPPVPVLRRTRLTMDDGIELTSDRVIVVGRNPSAEGAEKPFIVKDDTRSVSKTHLRVDGTGEQVLVTDLGSTNGSAIVLPDGRREGLDPEVATVLPAGSQIAIGDRILTVERDQ